MKAKEEAEKKQQELEEKLKKEEEERSARKKRIEEIMARTRNKGGATTPTSTPKKVRAKSPTVQLIVQAYGLAVGIGSVCPSHPFHPILCVMSGALRGHGTGEIVLAL